MTVTIPVSTAPKAVKAIYDATKAVALAAGDDVTVFWGDPTTTLPNDLIQIGMRTQRKSDPERLVGTGGAGWMDEDYIVYCICSSFTGDDDPVHVTERAWQLVGYLEEAVRQDPGLGDLVNTAWPSSAEDGGPEWIEATEDSAGGRKCDVTVGISVNATI
jgi:hypothetical protein